MNPPIQVQKETLSDTLYYNQISMLSYKINYPYFKTSIPGTSSDLNLDPLNLYYQEKAELLVHYCKQTLYPMAVSQYKENPSFVPYEIVRDYTVTYMGDCCLSLYTDIYIFTGGAHGNTVRFSNTWNLSDGSILFLKDFFSQNPNYEDAISQSIVRTINRQIKTPDSGNSTAYFENAAANVSKSFNPNNFYLTPNGIVVYFQQYDIAPYSSGMPTFLIPKK